MLGLSLHGWENTMVVLLIVAGFFALTAGIATWAVVRLQRIELSKTEEELARYKLDTSREISEANARAAEAKLALERFKSARNLSADQVQLVRTLIAEYKGQKFALWSYWLAVEPPAFARQLREEILAPAGWAYLQDKSTDPLTIVVFGVQVIASTHSTPEQQAAGKALVDALNQCDVAAYFRLYDHAYEGLLEIQVGIKS